MLSFLFAAFSNRKSLQLWLKMLSSLFAAFSNRKSLQLLLKMLSSLFAAFSNRKSLQLLLKMLVLRRDHTGAQLICLDVLKEAVARSVKPAGAIAQGR